MLLPAYIEALTFLLCGVIILMNPHDYSVALFICKERDIAWLNPWALGKVSVMGETKLLKQPYCCHILYKG